LSASELHERSGNAADGLPSSAALSVEDTSVVEEMAP
jgi:hypothetical protein